MKSGYFSQFVPLAAILLLIVLSLLFIVPDAITQGPDDTPVGIVSMFAGPDTEIPTGWLKCNGSGKNTDDYPALFGVIGYTYGGSGSTFNLPDFQDRVSMGATQANFGERPMTNVTGELTTEGGSATYDLQHSHGDGTLAAASHTHGAGTLQCPSHDHGDGTLAAAAHTHNQNMGGTVSNRTALTASHALSSSGSPVTTTTTPGTTTYYEVQTGVQASGADVTGSTEESGVLDITGSTAGAGADVTGYTAYSGTGLVTGSTANALSTTEEILPPYIATTYIIKATLVAAVPAVSELGLILLTLLLLVAGALVIRHLRMARAQS